MTDLILFTDGSGTDNQSPGGYAFALVELPDRLRLLERGWVPRASSQRMEMTAILQGLAALPNGTKVEVRSDSKMSVVYLQHQDHSNWTIGGADTWMRDTRIFIQRLIATNRLEVVFTHILSHGADPDPFNQHWNSKVDSEAGIARRSVL